MVDFVEITVQGGVGGDGVVSFRREKSVPKGGPDGGDGGNGGGVVLVASPSVNTLLSFRYRRLLRAERGQHGRGKKQVGWQGQDLRVQVPVGTVVTRYQGDGSCSVVELTRPGQLLVVAWGGQGGRGNTQFVGPTNQEPLLAECGEPGETAWLTLELKLLADVAIIGLPNAGKSTLLSAISAARPKVAPYPFTTTQVVLGVATVGWRDMVWIEVPGLIEGAHTGAGLGHTFLRHVERCRLLVHLLDGISSHLVDDWAVVQRELASFNPQLTEKPQVTVVNKVDVPEARQNYESAVPALRALGQPVLAISAATGEGVDTLLKQVATRLPPPELLPEGEATLGQRPRASNQVVVTKEGGAYVVEAPRAERLVKRSNLKRWEGLAQFRRALDRMGVATALERAGVQPGDGVRIGTLEMEWM